MATILTSKKVQLPVEEWTQVHFSTALAVSQEGGYVYVTWTEHHQYPRKDVWNNYEKLFEGNDLIAPSWWQTTGTFDGDFHPNSTWDPSYYVPAELGKESLQETISRFDSEEKARHAAEGLVRVYRSDWMMKSRLTIEGRGFDHDFHSSHLSEAGFYLKDPGEEITVKELMSRFERLKGIIQSRASSWGQEEVNIYLGYVDRIVTRVLNEYGRFLEPVTTE